MRFSIVLGAAAVMMLVLFTYAFAWLNWRPSTEPLFGVTYSWVYAEQLGLDPIEAYREIVDELGVRRVRFPLYWSEIEKAQNVYDWSLVDELIRFSEERDVLLTIIVGMKVPRWPECYIPDWAQNWDSEDQQRATLAFITEAITRYRDSTAVIRWQVENEPFFPFGLCPTITPEAFQERVDLVRSLDDRPIQMTVSGELEPWGYSARAADILGISLYRQIWNNAFGFFIYPVTPEFYFFRAQLVGDKVDHIIISELQAEPWFPEPIESQTLQAWYDAFTKEMLEDNIKFARDARLSEVYLWGVEWWYLLREAGDDRLWETARPFFMVSF